MQKALVSWSGGKDSAWALHLLRQQGKFALAGLLTTFNEAFDRVAMHGIRHDLMVAQAEAVGLPLWPVPLPWPCDNATYEARWREACRRALAEGVEVVVFGDLFLADIREYREKQLRGSGLEPLFPLWQRPTTALANEMVQDGLRAKLTCIDSRILPDSFAGREFDRALLNDLPQAVDPCGERGEFHSFVYAGPMLAKPIAIEVGEVVKRDVFVYADLLPATPPSTADEARPFG